MMNVEIFWNYYAISTSKKLLLDPQDEFTVLIWKVSNCCSVDTTYNVPEGSNLQVIIVSFHIPSCLLFTNYFIIWWCITWPTESFNKLVTNTYFSSGKHLSARWERGCVLLGHPACGGVTPHNWYLLLTIAGVIVTLFIVTTLTVILKLAKLVFSAKVLHFQNIWRECQLELIV